MICVGGSCLTIFVSDDSVLPHASSGPMSNDQMQWQYHPIFNDLCPSTHIGCSVSFGTDGNPHPTDELSNCSTDILRWCISSYIFWDQILKMCTEPIPVLNPPFYQTRCFFFPCVSMCAQSKRRVSNTKFHSNWSDIGKMKNACQILLWYIV